MITTRLTDDLRKTVLALIYEIGACVPMVLDRFKGSDGAFHGGDNQLLRQVSSVLVTKPQQLTVGMLEVPRERRSRVLNKIDALYCFIECAVL